MNTTESSSTKKVDTPSGPIIHLPGPVQEATFKQEANTTPSTNAQTEPESDDVKESDAVNSSIPKDPVPVVEWKPAPILKEAHGLGQLFHWLITEDQEMDRCLVSLQFLGAHMQHLILIAVMGLGAHGLFLGWFASYSHTLMSGYPILTIPTALVTAFLGGLLICLPSFYFYTQLAGLDVPFALVSAFSIRVLAKTAVLLFGLLPFFIAFVLLQPRLGLSSDAIFAIGVIFPFVVGFWGLRTLYYAFGRMSHLFPKTQQHRGNFLLRIVMAWGGVYLVVVPVALHHLLTKISLF